MNFEVGEYYKINWYTGGEPQYGYFRVINKMYSILTIEECNPWGGGPWVHIYGEKEKHVCGAIKVPSLIGMMEMFKRRRNED